MIISLIVVNVEMIRTKSFDPFSVIMCPVYIGWCLFGIFSYYSGLFSCAQTNPFYDWIIWSFVALAINLGGTVFMLKALRMNYHRHRKTEEDARRMSEEQRARDWNIGRERSRYIVPRTFSWNRATTERPWRRNEDAPYYQMDDMERLVSADTIRADNASKA